MKHNRLYDLAKEVIENAENIGDLLDDIQELDADAETRDPEALMDKEDEVRSAVEELQLCVDAMKGNV